MTTAEAHALATANPVRSLTTRLGELKEQADREIANLAATLKHIDETCALLKDHGLPQSVTLGPIGDSAAHARRAALADKGTPVFVAAHHRDTLPTGAAA